MWFDILKNYNYEWLMNIDGRPILLADLGNEKVLFYIRTGGGGGSGKPAAGDFSPFFGFSYLDENDSWFIKGNPDRYDKYEKEAQWLDNKIKEVPSLSSMGLLEANRLFKSKGATLGREYADISGRKVFYDYPLIMKTTVDAFVHRQIEIKLKDIEAEVNYWKKSEKYNEELLFSGFAIARWINNQSGKEGKSEYVMLFLANQTTGTWTMIQLFASMKSLKREWNSNQFLQSDGRPVYDIGKGRLQKQIIAINKFNKKGIGYWNEFMEVAQEWFEIDTEITYVEGKYVEVPLPKVHQINKDREEMR